MQMNKKQCQFIINLVKLPNGYSFDSLVQPEIPPSKKKIVKKSGTQNSTSKSMNRIARELALDLQQPSEQLPLVPEELENRLPIPEPEVQEEIQVDIRRQSPLPPCPAIWYDQMTIHDLEKAAFPQFFGQNTYKSPDLYPKYRNFIVMLYRRNPNQYLTKIACRRILRGDVTIIMKIHSFLQKQGLINFGVSKDGNYSFASSIFSKALNPQTKWPNPTQKMSDKDEELTHQPVDVTNLTISLVNKNFSKGNKTFCKKCEITCGLIWYNQRDDPPEKSQTSICLPCYQNLPQKQCQNYIKMDMVKRVQSISLSGNSHNNKPSWSIDDNMNLLEFAANPATSWSVLKQKYDNRKSSGDIIHQFMQFPISNYKLTNKQQQPVLSYSSDLYIKLLMQQLQNSQYKQQTKDKQQPIQQHSTDNNKFTEQMKNAVNKLCSKYQIRSASIQIRQQKINNSLLLIKNEMQPRKDKLLKMKNTEQELVNDTILNGNTINNFNKKISHNKKMKMKVRRQDDDDQQMDEIDQIDQSDNDSDEEQDDQQDQQGKQVEQQDQYEDEDPVEEQQEQSGEQQVINTKFNNKSHDDQYINVPQIQQGDSQSLDRMMDI